MGMIPACLNCVCCVVYPVHPPPSNLMWRNLLCQSAYQLAVTLFLVYAGMDSFGIDYAYLSSNGFTSITTDEYLGTFVFNAFVFMQVGSRCCSPPLPHSSY